MMQGLDDLIRELSQERTLPGGVSAWRFPELKELRLGSLIVYNPRLLLGMVRARTATYVGEGGEAAPIGRLALLERLELSALDEMMDHETWDEIKAILGEGASWDRAPHPEKVSKTGVESAGGGASAM